MRVGTACCDSRRDPSPHCPLGEIGALELHDGTPVDSSHLTAGQIAYAVSISHRPEYISLTMQPQAVEQDHTHDLVILSWQEHHQQVSAVVRADGSCQQMTFRSGGSEIAS